MEEMINIVAMHLLTESLLHQGEDGGGDQGRVQHRQRLHARGGGGDPQGERVGLPGLDYHRSIEFLDVSDMILL